jgi:hypothetical protein
MAKDEANEAAALSATLYEAASKNWKDDGHPSELENIAEPGD